jgi:Swt1-like HEPN
MITDKDIELFILKCSVVTHSVHVAFASQKVGSNRGVLEAQADSLVEGYLKQVDFAIVSNAERMSEFYKLFYSLENDMRELIESAMQEAKGTDWWNIAVPQIVRENVKKNYDREASEGLPPRSERFIEYTTFGELGEILKENWDVFSGMFSNASKNRVLRVINRLNIARGPIAHCNILPEEEAIRLKLAIRDWYKLME